MPSKNDYLVEHFSEVDDDQLQQLCRPGELTEEALVIALAELQRRELPLPAASEPVEDLPYEGDFVLAARYLNPTQAHLVCSCLQAAGIGAMVADAGLPQVNSLISIALGGTRVLVPAQNADDAQQIIQAFNRGDLALTEDEIPDSPAPD